MYTKIRTFKIVQIGTIKLDRELKTRRSLAATNTRLLVFPLGTGRKNDKTPNNEKNKRENTERKGCIHTGVNQSWDLTFGSTFPIAVHNSKIIFHVVSPRRHNHRTSNLSCKKLNVNLLLCSCSQTKKKPWHNNNDNNYNNNNKKTTTIIITRII